MRERQNPLLTVLVSNRGLRTFHRICQQARAPSWYIRIPLGGEKVVRGEKMVLDLVVHEFW